MLHNYLREVKQNSWRRISQSEIQNSVATESEGGQKFLPPNPLPFCPPERSVWRAKRAVSFVQKRFGFCQINAPKWRAGNQEVVGSNPAGGTKVENIEEILFILKVIIGGSPPEADKESLPAVGRPPGAPKKIWKEFYSHLELYYVGDLVIFLYNDRAVPLVFGNLFSSLASQVLWLFFHLLWVSSADFFGNQNTLQSFHSQELLC